MPLTALALNCTLKPSPASSSCDLLLKQTLAALQELDVKGEVLRVVDYTIKPGVTSDEGEGDEWPTIRQKVIDADILLIGSPVWLGHPSSLCQRVLERLDAFLSETDDKGHMPSYGKVAGVAVVGNEDGAHHIIAEVYQGLNDVGFTLPANSCTYWVGEAMGSIDFKDLSSTPDKVVQTTRVLAHNCVHLAKLLKARPYPAQ